MKKLQAENISGWYVRWMTDPNCIYRKGPYLQEMAQVIASGLVDNGTVLPEYYIAASEVLREAE